MHFPDDGASPVPWQALLKDGLDAGLAFRQFGDRGGIGVDLCTEFIAHGADLRVEDTECGDPQGRTARQPST